MKDAPAFSAPPQSNHLSIHIRFGGRVLHTLHLNRSFKFQTGVVGQNAIILVGQPVRCHLDLAPALAFEMDHLAPGDVGQQGIANRRYRILFDSLSAREDRGRDVEPESLARLRDW
jgi:hypothetical protein